jgi:uncharacterized protein
MGNDRWRSFRAAFRETDLWVAADTEHFRSDIETFTLERIVHYRSILDACIDVNPEFRDSLTPVAKRPGAHPIISEMCDASSSAGTGPMSAVAGAMSEFICNDLLSGFGLTEIIIENGGDIFLKLESPATISVYAGSSPLSDKIALRIKPEETPLSVCCSSGTVGHSLSFGVADACMIACRSGALADAYATAFCNEVKDRNMVHRVTEMALMKSDILSVVIIKDDIVGIGGKLEIII